MSTGFGMGISLLGKHPLQFCIYSVLTCLRSGKRLQRDDTRINIDLDAEEGRSLKEGGRTNKHIVNLRFTRQVDFNGLNEFLLGRVTWSGECIDTINFFDHLMREVPSQNYTQIKKLFFQRGEQRFDLGGGVEAFKGVFASLRPVLDDKYQKCLSVNVDVANCTFWRSQELTRVGSYTSILPSVSIANVRRLSAKSSIAGHLSSLRASRTPRRTGGTRSSAKTSALSVRSASLLPTSLLLFSIPSTKFGGKMRTSASFPTLMTVAPVSPTPSATRSRSLSTSRRSTTSTSSPVFPSSR